MSVIFAGIGFKRNGRGLGNVLQLYTELYSSVSFFNNQKMSRCQLSRCKEYLGITPDVIHGIHFRRQIVQDFHTYVSKYLRWPLPVSPSIQIFARLRNERLMRYICVGEVTETPGSTLLMALTIVETEVQDKAQSRKC